MCGWRRASQYWPGRGPFNYLPPWERPGWLYGPRACWRFYIQKARPAKASPDVDLEYLKNYAEELKRELEDIESRIKSLESQGER
ncbi:MAG: hypothetical protein QXQ66_05010 [Candidatus Hadarchaeum sp.]|uniref:hypothetical protein n=1 Tax=Candidatus Hadarchaeum sp. TaxID=2883567 RepID=UPI00316BF087